MNLEKEENEIEIIAEKSRKAAYIFLALIVVGVIIAAVGIILAFVGDLKFKSVGEQAVVFSLLGVGAAVIAVFSALFIKQLYRPYSLITLEKGELKLPDGTACKPNEITAVKKSGEKGKSGKIILTVNGKEIAVDGVVSCDKAYRKLCMLTGIQAEE